MKRRWGRLMGIILAGGVLMGCGQTQGAAQSLTADNGAMPNRTTQAEGEEPVGSGESAGNERLAGNGESAGSSQPTGREGAAGSEQPAGSGQPMETEHEKEWNREDSDDVETLRTFSWQLMTENMEQENPILSPVSAYLALGMVGMGAQGETEEEFRALLGSNMPGVSQRLMEHYPREQEGMTLTIANSVWVDERLALREQWIGDMEEIFRGEGRRGVLSSEEIMEQINGWCSDNTRGLVPTMLNQPFTADTLLVLLDAVYFKGDWLIPFEALNTRPRPFTVEDGTEKQVDTMSMSEAYLRYLHSELGEGVLLPYQGEDFAYVAILPREGMEARELQRQLTPEALDVLLESENRELCNLRLPKYEVSFDRELNDSLQAMGLIRAFDGDQADFSGLEKTDQGSSLYVSLVKQKAVFRVDEKGTEAAAVTMAVLDRCAAVMGPQPRELYFDRPFVYMILDMETRVPLFVGILDDPD